MAISRVCARAGSVLAALFALSAISAAPEAATPIPDFAPNDHTSWQPDRLDGDNFLYPGEGPGPVVSRPGYPYIPNGEGDFAATNPTYRIADLSNPILKPSVIAQMTRDNDEVLNGKIPFMARERCYPGGVPEFVIFRRVGAPMLFFVQSEKEVLMIWRVDQQVRHIHMNVPHSKVVKPSWYGESVGRYEGDTLVVDTIGLNTKTFVDNYRTPHSEALHVVERFRLIDNGRRMEVKIRVEDPGAFNAPWEAVQRFARFEGAKDNPGELSQESLCADSAGFPYVDYGNYGKTHTAGLVPMPQAAKPDF
jgi:hypothetical protein